MTIKPHNYLWTSLESASSLGTVFQELLSLPIPPPYKISAHLHLQKSPEIKQETNSKVYCIKFNRLATMLDKMGQTQAKAGCVS